MADLKINTDLVSSVATSLSTLNTQMNEGYSSVASSVQRMDACWDGSAATKAITKINEIKSTLVDARFDVLKNYVQFLRQQIGVGYDTTETNNKSLADTLK